ncbi:uncharacterized protein ARMOST_19839 [Armillaria ostoyae]|uniref:Uncharacterized protein n=1 Tax=Armillaria ostoyae TaxID=47428 RepID=A0A284S5N1_ARMOS|nr:uncharacterized protein ARMOST_19839 [Armillaria ostoyae]
MATPLSLPLTSTKSGARSLDLVTKMLCLDLGEKLSLRDEKDPLRHMGDVHAEIAISGTLRQEARRCRDNGATSI